MKKTTTVLSAFAIVFALTNVVTAQTKTDGKEVKYRRSSLATILIESENFPKKEVVLKAYNTAPFPDKYNNHQLETKSFDPTKYVLTDAEKPAPTNAGKAGKLMKGAASSATGGAVDKDAAEMPLVIAKYAKQNNIGRQLVAKWFNRQADGSFDINLISERGIANASFIDMKTAAASSDGMALLKTAGLDLIGNTFVVFSKMNFVANEPVAAVARDIAKAEAGQIKVAAMQQAAIKSADAAYEKAKEGYTIWTTSYLFRLKWNDTVANAFWTDMYMEKGGVDAKKKTAFDNANFQLEYVGDEKANSIIIHSMKEKRTEDQIVAIGTVRNIDNVFAKLQKKFEVFKTKTPLFTGDPATAKIGMKEGLEGGEKFEVLEANMDPKTGVITYKSKGKITVKEDMIWDNRYTDGAPLEDPTADATAAPKPVLDKTTFKGGGKDYYSGMLLRQLK